MPFFSHLAVGCCLLINSIEVNYAGCAGTATGGLELVTADGRVC